MKAIEDDDEEDERQSHYSADGASEDDEDIMSNANSDIALKSNFSNSEGKAPSFDEIRSEKVHTDQYDRMA